MEFVRFYNCWNGNLESKNLIFFYDEYATLIIHHPNIFLFFLALIQSSRTRTRRRRSCSATSRWTRSWSWWRSGGRGRSTRRGGAPTWTRRGTRSPGWGARTPPTPTRSARSATSAGPSGSSASRASPRRSVLVSRCTHARTPTS